MSREKYQCNQCGAIHWYTAEKCQRCATPFPKQTMPAKPENKEPDFFSIDENQLDREWVQQPKLYGRYSKRAAIASQELEQEKTALEVVTADLSLKIRKNPINFGIEKVTDKAIDAAVTVHPKYQAAVQAVITAKYKLAILEAAVKTLDHRKRALEKLVDLRLAHYFAEPRESSANREARDAAAVSRFRRGD